MSIAQFREPHGGGRPLPFAGRSRDRHAPRTRIALWSRGRLDPVLVALVALAVYAAHGYAGLLDRDLGVFVYGGEHVARGIPPYAGIFNTVGPLADLMPGLAIWTGHLAGLDPILSARVLFTVLSAGCCVVLSVLAREVFGSRAAGLLAPAVFLTFERFIQLATDGPREKTTMVLFLLAALLLVVRRRWVLAGVCTALSTLAWQPSFAVAVTAAAVGILTLGGGRRRAVSRFIVGGMIPSGIAVAYFALTGSLHAAVNGFVLVNLLYTHQPSVLSAPANTLRFLWQGYHLSLVVFAAGLVALVLLTMAQLRPLLSAGQDATPRRARAVAITTIGVAALTASAWTMVAFNGSPDLFELLPFGALGAAGAVLALGRWLTPRLTVATVGALTAAAVALAAVESVNTTSYRLDQQRADVTAVLAAAPSGATLLSINAPEVLAISGRTNLSHYQVFDGAINAYLKHRWPGGLMGYSHYVGHLHPTLIAVASGYTTAWPQHLLLRHYRWVGHGASWTWYLRRSAGLPALAAVRAANWSVMGAAAAPHQPALRAALRAAAQAARQTGGLQTTHRTMGNEPSSHQHHPPSAHSHPSSHPGRTRT